MQSKHTFLLAFLLTFLSLPTILFAQTTEGTDFWVTFMQADQGDNKMFLELSISSRSNCNVTISNPFTGYTKQVSVTANQRELVRLYEGSPKATNARNDMKTSKAVCYAVNSEVVDTCALHVVATQPISLFASNYKYATFDATNVLPTESLQDNYIIQTYSPSDHDGATKSQGSHFAIIATEDNTVVEYTPTAYTFAIRSYLNDYATWGDDLFNDHPEYRRYQGYTLGQTMLTDTLMAGQVYYVWTDKAVGDDGDLSGTLVKAKDGKKIAVFQGNPHTNVPDGVKQRDHLFSQAMPTTTWGNTFAVTASKSNDGERARDIFRLMALHDGTTVYVDGDSVYTFDFATRDPKQFWEFEIGSSTASGRSGVKYFSGNNHIITTSCACALHEFIASQVYGNSSNKQGDPAMIWINPIEQQINQITFATYESLGKDGSGTDKKTTYHFVNVVTDHPNDITLDNNSIATQFRPFEANSHYSFAQISLGSNAASHTLKATQGGFIAHVYGYTENESYGYSAGGNVATLTQSIMINGVEFTPEAENTLCGIDTIHFVCDLDYTYTSITWDFGDGSPAATGTKVDHFYAHTGDYPAKCTILRESSNLCQGELAEYIIPINVHIGKLEFRVDSTVNHICESRQLELYYTNTGTAFTDDNCVITCNAKAASAGVEVKRQNNYFLIKVPEGAEEGDGYSFKLDISTGCGDTSAVVNFAVPFDPDKLIVRRYSSVFLVDTTVLNAKKVLAYQWYDDGVIMPEDTTGVLSVEGDTISMFKVRITYINAAGETIEQETCGISFHYDNSGLPQFGDAQAISAISGLAGDQLFFCTTAEGEASLYNIHGQLVNTYSLTNEGGLIDLPTDKGVYVLRIKTANEKAALKVYVY